MKKKNTCSTTRLSQKVYKRDFLAVFLQIQSDIYIFCKIERNYTFIPTSLFRDCALFRSSGDFNDKNIHTCLFYT